MSLWMDMSKNTATYIRISIQSKVLRVMFGIALVTMYVRMYLECSGVY